jgi:hypothetical protein
MQINKKITVLTSLLVAGIISIAAIEPTPPPPNDFTNLQVLPKDISHQALHHIMADEFSKGLGVKCGFCHAQQKDDSLHLDFASDEKPEKEIARSMMRMTLDINKKYFEVEHPMIGDTVMSVSCVTCHHASPHPDALTDNK